MSNLNISGVAATVIALIDVSKDLYVATARAMDIVETQGTLNGIDKKTWVLAFIKNEILSPKLWVVWVPLLSKFIDSIKGIFNTVKATNITKETK